MNPPEVKRDRLAPDLVLLTRAEADLVERILDTWGAVTNRELGEAGRDQGLHACKHLGAWGLRVLRAAVQRGLVVKVAGGKAAGGRGTDVYARPGAPISPGTALRYGIAGAGRVRRDAAANLYSALESAMRTTVLLSTWLEDEDKHGPQRKTAATDGHVDQALELLYTAARSVGHAMGAVETLLGPRKRKPQGGTK